MQHSFDIEIAKQYGILEAVLLNNLYFWIEKNRANNTNFYDGFYWTYNSTRAFSHLFPYVSEKQIKTALKHLRDEEIIQVGNYNKSAYDRTLWYAFTNKGRYIVHTSKYHSTDKYNGEYDEVRPIPDINTDIKTNNIINSGSKEPNNNKTKMINDVIEYMNNCGELEKFKIKKKFSFKANASSNKKIIIARINEDYTLDDFKDVIYNAYDKFIEHEFKGYNGKSSIQYYNPNTIFTSSKMEQYKNEYQNM